MRVMVLVKATDDSERAFSPRPRCSRRWANIMTSWSRPASCARPTASSPPRRASVLRTMVSSVRSSTGLPRNPRFGRRLLALGGQGHGRGGRLGEALPQSHAGTERDRNPAAVRDGRFASKPDIDRLTLSGPSRPRLNTAASDLPRNYWPMSRLPMARGHRRQYKKQTSARPLLALSGHQCPRRAMSALRGKADAFSCSPSCPLMTQSGHGREPGRRPPDGHTAAHYLG